MKPTFKLLRNMFLFLITINFNRDQIMHKTDLIKEIANQTGLSQKRRWRYFRSFLKSYY